MTFLLAVFFIDDFSEIALYSRMVRRLVNRERSRKRETEEARRFRVSVYAVSERPVS